MSTDMITNQVTPGIVLHLLGGEWPKSEDYGYPEGFCWDQVEEFNIEKGQLVPYRGGHPMDGPNLQLDAVPNPLTRVTADNSDLT